MRQTKKQARKKTKNKWQDKIYIYKRKKKTYWLQLGPKKERKGKKYSG